MASNGEHEQGAQNLQIQGGAAIVAPANAFQGSVPANALIVVPITKPTDDLLAKLQQGAVVVTNDQMWQLMGFNGPAVQVSDDQGRPIAIGLDDLLGGLEQHWNENPNDLGRARMYAQELLKYKRLDRAENVLTKVVAKGGTGEDWLALGICQLQQDKLDKAEGTLKGAASLMQQNPYPSLHLARLYTKKGDLGLEAEHIDKALAADAGCVDAWAYLFQTVRDREGEEAAVARLEARAAGQANAAPWVALQGFFANQEATRDRAIAFAEKGVAANDADPLALLVLSALYGQAGKLDRIVEVLEKHEAKMGANVHLANNYFEALFQTGRIDRVTKLLNALAASSNKEVKQFAIQRSQAVAQFIQQQRASTIAKA